MPQRPSLDPAPADELLEKALNEQGPQGWQLKAVIAGKIKGHIGPVEWKAFS